MTYRCQDYHEHRKTPWFFKLAAIVFGLLFMPLMASAAIAFDTSATAAASSLSFTPGITGAVDFVIEATNASPATCSTASIGGTAATLQKSMIPGARQNLYIWNVASTAVTTSAITASITCTGSPSIFVNDYSGVDGTNPVDAKNNGEQTGTSPAATATTTTTVANDWIVALVNSNAFNLSAGSGTNLRQGASPADIDGGPFATPQTNNLNVTWTGGSQTLDFVSIALQPVAASTATYDASNWWSFFTL